MTTTTTMMMMMIIIIIIIIIILIIIIIEIKYMWNMKAKMILIIIGATRTISKSLRQNMSNIPGKGKMKEMYINPYWTLHTY